MRITNLIVWVFIAILFVSCGTMEMSSNWRDREIKIDGYQDDWEGVLIYLEKKKISVGILNDDDYLYTCLVTGDRRTQSQILRLGFTVWFDAKGGKDKRVGIHFPIGIKDMEPSGLREMMREPQPGMQRTLPRFRLNEVELLGPGEDDRRREIVSDLKGLEIKLQKSLDVLVYEIKVPLFQSDQNSFSVAANSGDIIGIGFETTRIDMESARNEMRDAGGGAIGGRRGGMRGSGKRGAGSGMGGAGGGMRGGLQMPEQLNVWAKVQLAK